MDKLYKMVGGNRVELTEDEMLAYEAGVVAAEAEQVEFAKTEYQRMRAAEYPSLDEQMDLLFHGGYDAWKAEIQAVKDKYPKT